MSDIDEAVRLARHLIDTGMVTADKPTWIMLARALIESAPNALDRRFDELATEARTAEAIAAWLEGKNSVAGATFAADVRSGAWRKP